MFKNCSDCCAEEGEGLSPRRNAQGSERNIHLSVEGDYSNLHATHESVRSVTVDEKTDRERAKELSETKDRQWVAITAYQPIDTVTKTVEVPVIRTVDTYVPKVTVEEKIIEVPKYIPEYVEKVVEVPEVKIVDKIVEVPQYQYQYKYVPKIETKENVIQRPKYETKYIEKIVEVPQIKEVVRYQEVEEIEEIIKYVPKGQAIPEEWKESEKREEEVSIHQTVESRASGVTSTPETYITNAMEPPKPMPTAVQYGMPPQYQTVPGMVPPQTRVEQLFKPKVVKTVEIQKHVPISVDVPVPYMVPKPVVVPVQVPVLKFRDHFVPVPVRRRVVPRIKWTNEVYEVECIKEKPYLQVQDIIKPVPCDVEIKIHEYVEKAQPINPAELSQADIHAMWMRVNADLADKKKAEYGDKYPYVKHPDGTVFGEPGISREDDNGEEGGMLPNLDDIEVTDDEEEIETGELTLEEKEQKKRAKDERILQKKREKYNKMKKERDEVMGLEPLALHPGHPLAMTYMQNEWIKKETTATHEMYSPEWFEQHQKALHNLQMKHPTQVQISAEQAAQLRPQHAAFGDAPWLDAEQQHYMQGQLHKAPEQDAYCKLCGTSCNCC